MAEDKAIAEVKARLKEEGFTKVEPGDVWDFEKDKVMEGTFIGIEEGVGQNNSNLYHFKTKEGRLVDVWGSAILDVRLKNVEMGEEVVIIYHGRSTSEKTGRTYKDFEVHHKSIEEPPLEDIDLTKDPDA